MEELNSKGKILFIYIHLYKIQGIKNSISQLENLALIR